jgi:hypothetical protein
VAPRTKAIISPALLTWARETAGLDLADAADLLRVDPEFCKLGKVLMRTLRQAFLNLESWQHFTVAR